MKNTARAAQKLGVERGQRLHRLEHLARCSIRSRRCSPQMIDDGFKLFAERWNPILDVFGECGVKFALEVHPTEIAFDLYTAERALEALDHREEFGFNFDPSHLLWQGVDPVEFIRAFPDRIYHVHMKDAIVTLNGRSGILAQPPELRRSAPRLGLPLAGPRRRELRGDHPRAEPGRLRRARCRSNGKTAAWTASTARRRPASSSRSSTSRRATWRSTRRLRSRLKDEVRRMTDDSAGSDFRPRTQISDLADFRSVTSRCTPQVVTELIGAYHAFICGCLSYHPSRCSPVPAIADLLAELRVTHVIWLPDSGLGAVENGAGGIVGVSLFALARESEAWAIAAGLHIGGARPLVIMQTTGMFESGDSLRNALFDLGLPLFAIIGHRSYLVENSPDTAKHFAEPILRAWGIDYVLLTRDDELPRLGADFLARQAAGKPGVALVAEGRM